MAVSLVSPGSLSVYNVLKRSIPLNPYSSVGIEKNVGESVGLTAVAETYSSINDMEPNMSFVEHEVGLALSRNLVAMPIEGMTSLPLLCQAQWSG